MTGASLTGGGSDARRTYDPGILEIKVEGMDGLIAHATVTLGKREDWLIEFTAWTGSTMGSSWCTWVFVEGSGRRRDLTAYYDNEGEWVRLGGVLLDDLSPTFAVLNHPEVEEDVFDVVVQVLNGTDYLAVSPVDDHVLVDHATGEPYNLSRGEWDELDGLPLWRPRGGTTSSGTHDRGRHQDA